MKKLKILLFTFIVIIHFSCEENFSPIGDFEEKYTLNCIIRGDNRFQTATLTKTYFGDGKDAYSNTEDPAVKDAIIKADEWIDNNIEINQNVTQKKIFLFGGAEIYKIGLEYCDNIEMTKVKFNLKTGVKFPKLKESDWKKTKLEHNLATNDVPEHSYWHYKSII